MTDFGQKFCQMRGARRAYPIAYTGWKDVVWAKLNGDCSCTSSLIEWHLCIPFCMRIMNRDTSVKTEDSKAKHCCFELSCDAQHADHKNRIPILDFA